MKKRSKKTERPERSVFFTIFLSVLIILAVEIVLLGGSIFVSRVPEQLNRNAEDILAKQVENRSSYLGNFLVQAQDLSELSEQINVQTEKLLADGTLSLDTLGSGSDSSEPLLTAVSDSMIAQLRRSSVTGVFVVLNTCDLDTDAPARLPGIYLRDLDPDAAASERNEDLMLEFASGAIVKSMHISTDSGWQPTLDYEKVPDFVYEPFETAFADGGALLPAAYGRWTTSPYMLPDDNRTAIAYSQPLILPDGTVYGVVGVELLSSYLCEQLPMTELQNDGAGTYLLAETDSKLSDRNITLHCVLFSGKDSTLQKQQAHITFLNQNSRGTMIVDGTKYFASAMPLTLYDRNAPFSGEHWVLLGAVPTDALYRFANDMKSLLLLAVFITLAVGILLSYLVSRGLARPITQLSAEVAAVQDKNNAIPQLSRTGIRELDRFSSAITQLSREILDTSTKFLRIMDMASIELGGYEIRNDSDKVFVTDNFFSMFGMPEIDTADMTVARFEALMEDIVLQKDSFGLMDGGCVFTIPQEDGTERFVMLRITCENDVQVGLAEDVTAATVERRRIEHERDYDVLTGLYNRRAFGSRTEALFRTPEKLKHAALLMMDMDNLKHINDTFGHDWGDRYINLAGSCFADALPQNTVCARLSGDEFIVLFYGYDSSDAIRRDLKKLSNAMQARTAVLPNGDTMHISISGGVAWYPENGTDMTTLKKYADFAMYQVKRSTKGKMGEFDIGAYHQEAYETQLRSEFLQMLRNGSVSYYFQPIFSALTGRVAAYEALMRIDMPLLRSPLTVMKLAREMDKLYEVEYLTAFKACGTFEAMQQKGRLHQDVKLFVNSIANISLNDADMAEFHDKFVQLLPHIVIEITEEEEINREALNRKRGLIGEQGKLALDDWGSGYSNSNSLLELAPDYIKVDITIIRDIDTDPDKQQLVSSIVDYAHRRGMKIVAEGIETENELRKVIELGVDLLQGYFLARPAAAPGEIAPGALTIIDQMNHY